MARDYFINGTSLVRVKGIGSLANQDDGDNFGKAKLWELGLAQDPIVLSPKFHHKDVFIDDFGPNVPAEVLWMLAEVRITMNLVHFDISVLRKCLANSMGNANAVDAFDGSINEGEFAGAGIPMGGNKNRFVAGNQYISLNIRSEVVNGGLNWRFPTAYLAESPMTFPMGTERTIASLNWRAIPYGRPKITLAEVGATTIPDELVSVGTVLWDHILDD